jgi:hypothetical protein
MSDLLLQSCLSHLPPLPSEEKCKGGEERKETAKYPDLSTGSVRLSKADVSSLSGTIPSAVCCGDTELAFKRWLLFLDSFLNLVEAVLLEQQQNHTSTCVPAISSNVGSKQHKESWALVQRQLTDSTTTGEMVSFSCPFVRAAYTRSNLRPRSSYLPNLLLYSPPPKCREAPVSSSGCSDNLLNDASSCSSGLNQLRDALLLNSSSSDDVFKLVSVGGGPGFDAVGLVAFLAFCAYTCPHSFCGGPCLCSACPSSLQPKTTEAPIRSRKRHVEVAVFDIELGWEHNVQQMNLSLKAIEKAAVAKGYANFPVVTIKFGGSCDVRNNIDSALNINLKSYCTHHAPQPVDCFVFAFVCIENAKAMLSTKFSFINNLLTLNRTLACAAARECIRERSRQQFCIFMDSANRLWRPLIALTCRIGFEIEAREAMFQVAQWQCEKCGGCFRSEQDYKAHFAEVHMKSYVKKDVAAALPTLKEANKSVPGSKRWPTLCKMPGGSLGIPKNKLVLVSSPILSSYEFSRMHEDGKETSHAADMLLRVHV